MKAKDLEGIVSQLRVTAGVEVAIFLYELESGEFKVSLRSKERWTSARWHGILAGAVMSERQALLFVEPFMTRSTT